MKTKYILTFPQNIVNNPITYWLVKKYSLQINILRAQISENKRGYLLVDIIGEENEIENGLQFLSDNNVEIKPFIKQLNFKKENCVNCGSCTGVCHSNALYLDKTSREVIYNHENCTACGLCIKACPLQLFDFNFNGFKNAN